MKSVSKLIVKEEKNHWTVPLNKWFDPVKWRSLTCKIVISLKRDSNWTRLCDLKVSYTSIFTNHAPSPINTKVYQAFVPARLFSVVNPRGQQLKAWLYSSELPYRAVVINISFHPPPPDNCWKVSWLWNFPTISRLGGGGGWVSGATNRTEPLVFIHT